MKIWWSVESQYFVPSNLVILAGLASGCFQTAFLVCMCRKLHINSNFIFGNTIVTIGWSTFYPILCPKILLHHQCHCQPPHLFCLQYQWNLKVPPEQELESEGKGRKRKFANYCHPRYFFFCRDFLAEHLKWVSERDKSVLQDASFFLLL